MVSGKTFRGIVLYREPGDLFRQTDTLFHNAGWAQPGDIEIFSKQDPVDEIDDGPNVKHTEKEVSDPLFAQSLVDRADIGDKNPRMTRSSTQSASL